MAIGRAGLGYFPSTQIHKAMEKQRWNLIQEEVRGSAEEERRRKMVGLCRQCNQFMTYYQVLWTYLLEGRAEYYGVHSVPAKAH